MVQNKKKSEGAKYKKHRNIGENFKISAAPRHIHIALPMVKGIIKK
jgi:hypothetical protein